MTVDELTRRAMKIYGGNGHTITGEILDLFVQAEGIAKSYRDRQQIHESKCYCRLAYGSYAGG